MSGKSFITAEDVAVDAIANDELGKQAASVLQFFRGTTIAEIGGLVSSSDAETPAPTDEDSIITGSGNHAESLPEPAGAIRDSMKARQDNLHLDRDEIDPMALPPGAIRDSMKARQANLHLDRDDVDPMALPPGEARQNNL
jgi:hypothetical protein